MRASALSTQRLFRERPFGDLSTVLTSLTNSAVDQAVSQGKSAAQQYATDFYNEHQAEILLAAIAIITWVLWVSTRSTCNHKQGAHVV